MSEKHKVFEYHPPKKPFLINALDYRYGSTHVKMSLEELDGVYSLRVGEGRILNLDVPRLQAVEALLENTDLREAREEKAESGEFLATLSRTEDVFYLQSLARPGTDTIKDGDIFLSPKEADFAKSLLRQALKHSQSKAKKPY